MRPAGIEPATFRFVVQLPRSPTEFCYFFLILYRSRKELILFDMSPGVEWFASEDDGGRQVHRYVKTTLPMPDYSVTCVLIAVSFRSIRCLCVSYLSSNLCVKRMKLLFKNAIWRYKYISSLTVNKLRRWKIVTDVCNNFTSRHGVTHQKTSVHNCTVVRS